jgi:hypothetical protein
MLHSAATERFMAKVEVVESGCAEWRAALHRDGYGKFTFGRKTIAAHKAAWLIFRGEVPAGKWVLHTCDNRKCVNLDHLYLGTPSDNVRDKIERCAWWGRMKTPREQVDQAIAMYATGRFSQQQIGDMLGIRQTQVSRYVRGQQRRIH